MKPTLRPGETDVGNGSCGICHVINASRLPSHDPSRWSAMRLIRRYPFLSYVALSALLLLAIRLLERAGDGMTTAVLAVWRCHFPCCGAFWPSPFLSRQSFCSGSTAEKQ